MYLYAESLNFRHIFYLHAIFTLMIHVYKASAGAGKTFILTQEYIKLLFQNPQNFKQTLAVTFTNKASAEMKHRIITSLYELAYKKDSPYMAELEKTTQKDKDSICITAQNILHEILHNYSFFFIETIDSFFQRVIRNFAKENNLHSSYNLELNQGEVIEKAVLQMFLELSEELPAFKIIRDFSDYKVQEGKSRNVLHEIISYSSILFNEQYMMRADSIHTVNLPDFFKKITNIQHTFETKITKLSSQFAELMSKHQLTVDDFSGKKRGFIGKLHAIQNGFDEKKELTLIQKTNIGEISKWHTKNSPSKNVIEAFAHAGGYDLAMEIVNMLESEEGKIYYTAKEILTQKYLLQIVHQVQHHIDEYLKQENLFLISNTNSLLASLINEHDAPFVYEKIGHYIKNLMIDEFQDTSQLQWKNFLPLMQNVLSEGGFSLVVGDVKQSIYRFRNGDWQILHSDIAQQFPNRITEHTRVENWRSQKYIIDFNNTLFTTLQQTIQPLFSNYFENYVIADDDPRKTIFETLYKDVEQTYTKKTKSGGYVRIDRVGDENDTKITTDEYAEHIKKSCINFIIELHKTGYKPEDIAFLVPKNGDISKIVTFCNEAKKEHPEYKDIFSIVSSEALKINSSKAVQFIIAFFQWIDTPNCKVTRATLLRYYGLLVKREDELLPLSQFSEIEAVCKKIMHAGSIFEITDLFIKEYNLGTIPEETAFVHSLQDTIYTFSLKQANSISLFLEWWDENNDSLFVSQTDIKGAMRAMTIHKSKGLQFKVVIMPFMNWSFVNSHKNISMLHTDDTAFDEMSMIPLALKKGLIKTQFSEQYISEIMQIFIDNYNKLYVACTRAEDVLYMTYSPNFAHKHSNTAMNFLLENTITALKTNTSLSLHESKEELSRIFTVGSLQKLEAGSSKEPTDSDTQTMEEYAVFKSHAHLLPIPEAAAYFTYPDTSTSQKFGLRMHRILEHIRVASDVSAVISEFVVRGEIDISEQKELENYIIQKISDKSVADWFSGKYKILSEQSILLPNAKERRPDRIMIQDSHAIIVDYKFTQKKEEAHRTQVSEYQSLLHDMGYTTEGFVWYCLLQEVVAV